jgi:predicted Rossmann fold flavoprotein
MSISISNKENPEWDVVVIGGGPAGMIAAGRASSRRRKVLLLEKNKTLGKKLLITGGGRCNVTNNKTDIREMLSKYKSNDKFLFSAFSQFAVKETINFFRERGVEFKEENDGRMFPETEKAETIWKTLVDYMEETGVKVQTGSEVRGIEYSKENKEILIFLKNGEIIKTKSCIMAVGGTSRPETGSTGEGFMWLKKLGHKILDSDVSLVPIAIKESWVNRVSGVSLTDIKLTTFKDKVKQKAYKGKLLFTHFGISGPTVLNMSRDVGDLLSIEEGEEYENKRRSVVTIVLDLFPGLDNSALKEKVQSILIGESNKKIKNSLSPFIPSALVPAILELAKIDGDTPNHSVRTEDRKILLALLKSIPLQVKGLLGKDKAVVSSGGVALEQVDFKTMQSRLIPNLFLVGDVLNIDRPSGGYSLQLCWTTGFVAGNSC